ncbi:MAG: hypothetical protein AB8B65_06070 [Kordia sp.]|uniref:hypothetical protein n=1 Tax=Kordia sp. TaxID=1965332 RepID=UPI00385E165E
MRSFFKTSCLSAIVLLLSFTTAYSQNTVTLEQDNSPTVRFFLIPHHNPLFGLGYVNPQKSLIEIADGSQFRDDEFREVKAAESGETFKARYNAFLDEMEVQAENKSGWINKNQYANKIIFTDNNVAYKILDADDRENKRALGYYEVLLENDYVSLYKRAPKKLAVGMEQLPYMTPAPKFITEFQDVKAEYYVEFHKSGNVQKLSRTRRGVSKIFDDKKAIVKAYIKENGLKVTRDQDMINIITFVNSL